MNNLNNNINFTARMDISKITMNKNRWNNIAKLFEQRTQKYPNDTFYMEDLANGISGYNINPKTGSEICANIFGLEFDRLMNMSDTRIVAKFKKMLDISAKQQKIYNATNQYLDKIEKITKNRNEDTKIWDIVVDIANNETKKLQSQDSFLKDVDIMF